jgi:hypothetical protein
MKFGNLIVAWLQYCHPLLGKMIEIPFIVKFNRSVIQPLTASRGQRFIPQVGQFFEYLIVYERL